MLTKMGKASTAEERHSKHLPTSMNELLAQSNDEIIKLIGRVPSATIGITLPPPNEDDDDHDAGGTIPSSSTSNQQSTNKDNIQSALDAVKDALASFGVIPNGSSNSKDPVVWRRNLVPCTLYQPPRAQPSPTTLMPLSKVPPGAKIHRHDKNHEPVEKKKEGNDDSNEEEDPLVEVWTYSLFASSSDQLQQPPQPQKQRPLVGNLSSKLVEYTRGAMGVCRPFRPGGMDDDYGVGVGKDYHQQGDNANDDDTWDKTCDNPFLSEEAIANARRALTIGSKQAWMEGILITAPPGLSFTEGLRYEDVFDVGDEELISRGGQQKMDDDNDISAVDDAGAIDDAGYESKQTGNTVFTNSSSSASNGAMIRDKSYFDDDSLFGDRSSDDEESNDGFEENHQNDDDTDDQTLAEVLQAPLPLTTSPSQAEDEVDALLHEFQSLEQSKMGTFSKSSSTTISIHPHVFTSASGNDSTSRKNDDHDPKTRKSWAVTDYIPITTTSDFHALLPNPALTFPFELDDFQKQALLRLERAECVFLAAHTSAGKTVCAEYAIALAKKHCTRAIYTSPIKALSNQKYRDFRNKFGEDVGLITGDMQIGADSSCLIMTTEILRSMLYRGADLIRDIEWVIFDEVHYINDSERGVVWEEVIIMLPDYVNLIFLSATTPNTIEFSEWIGRTKRKPVHVISTSYRPVPLSHHLWAKNKMHKIMEGKHGFLPKGYADATKALLPASARAAAEKKSEQKQGAGGTAGKPSPAPSKPATGSKMSSWQQQGTKQDWIALTRHLEKEELMPTVTFSFSKKKCEEIADMLSSLDLNTAAEKNLVQSFALQTVARLSPNDQCLPQVVKTVEMVKRGIGVHHGGLLPILKEMVEILFSRNLIKILFATETFAMGVNMPARSVVFNAIRKHDGFQFRDLQPGEYTQMAGRAGRRGLDKVGTVVLCCFGDTPPPQTMLKNMLTGSSTKLQSQFRLTFTMILNLLRVEDMSVEGMIKRSFSEFATQRALTTNEFPKLLARGTKTLLKLDNQFKQDAHSRVGCEDIEEYFFACRNVLTANKKLLSYIIGSGGTGGGALVTGRVILVTSARDHKYVCTPALVLRPPELSKNPNTDSDDILECICMVLLPQSFTPSAKDVEQCVLKLGALKHVGEARGRYFTVQAIKLDEIFFVSSVKHKIDSKVFYKGELSNTIRGVQFGNPFSGAKSTLYRQDDFNDSNPFAGIKARGKKGDVSSHSKTSGLSHDAQLVDDAMSYLLNAEEAELNSGQLGVLDLRECAKNMHQGNSAIEFAPACERLENGIAIARQFQSHYHPNLESHYKSVERKETLRSRLKILRHLLSNESLQLFPDFEMRKAVLQSLGYVDENDTVSLKGRVACEVNTCEGLIVTEMVFGGMLNELEPPEIVAALSALLFQEKTDDDIGPELPERLISSCERMKAIAIGLGQKQKEFGLAVDPIEYCAKSLKMGLVHVVYEWACGVPFSSICELTEVQEGSIVRCITRLDELCREVRNCARVVGNPTLYRKMEAASEAIKRDIVFASSLYVS